MPQGRVQGSTDQWVEQGCLEMCTFSQHFYQASLICWRFPSSPKSSMSPVLCPTAHKIATTFPPFFLSLHQHTFFHLFCTSSFFLYWTKLSSFLSWTKGHKIKPHAVLSLVQMFACKHIHNKCHHSCALCIRCEDR